MTPNDLEIFKVWGGETNHSNKRKVLEFGRKMFELGEAHAVSVPDTPPPTDGVAYQSQIRGEWERDTAPDDCDIDGGYRSHIEKLDQLLVDCQRELAAEQEAHKQTSRQGNATADGLYRELTEVKALVRAEDIGVCEKIDERNWELYKRGNGIERADPHYQGISSGAGKCAEAIRSLTTTREEKSGP